VFDESLLTIIVILSRARFTIKIYLVMAISKVFTVYKKTILKDFLFITIVWVTAKKLYFYF